MLFLPQILFITFITIPNTYNVKVTCGYEQCELKTQVFFQVRRNLNVLELGAVPAVSQSCTTSLPVLQEGDGPQRYEDTEKHCSSIIKQDTCLQRQTGELSVFRHNAKPVLEVERLHTKSMFITAITERTVVSTEFSQWLS